MKKKSKVVLTAKDFEEVNLSALIGCPIGKAIGRRLDLATNSIEVHRSAVRIKDTWNLIHKPDNVINRMQEYLIKAENENYTDKIIGSVFIYLDEKWQEK